MSKLLAQLKSIEWLELPNDDGEGVISRCPACDARQYYSKGHDSNCWLVALIRREEIAEYGLPLRYYVGKLQEIGVRPEWRYFVEYDREWWLATTDRLVESGGDGLLSSVSGRGATVEQAFNELWNNMTNRMPGKTHIRVSNYKGVKRYTYDHDRDKWEEYYV